MTAGQITGLAVAAALVFWMLGAYNRLVRLRNGIATAWALVDDALRHRAETLTTLIGTLREPLMSETAALDAVLAGLGQTAAAADAMRPRPVLADRADALVQADTQLAAATTRVRALCEASTAAAVTPQVPELLAALKVADERVAFARKKFNEAAYTYNTAARQFPTRLLTRLYGFGTAGRL